MIGRAQRREQYLDDLARIVDGDRDAIAKHADFLADDDEARDLRHEATGVVAKIAAAGADHISPSDLEQKLLAALDARGGHGEGLESTSRKTDPGFLADPVGAPVATASVTPSREQFGSTVRANAFAPDAPTTSGPTTSGPTTSGPTTSGEMRSVPATRAMDAVPVDAVAASASEAAASASKAAASASKAAASASEGSVSASEAFAKPPVATSNVVSLDAARERAKDSASSGGASSPASGGKLGVLRRPRSSAMK